MKRTMAVLCGALTLLGIGITIVIASSDWISENFIRSDDDMNTVGKIQLLGIYPALIIIGGWIGSALFNKWRRIEGR